MVSLRLFEISTEISTFCEIVEEFCFASKILLIRRRKNSLHSFTLFLNTGKGGEGGWGGVKELLFYIIELFFYIIK